jgi:hypothetical protein
MTSKRIQLNEYEFSLRFDITAVDCAPEACLDRLAEAGCTDAVVGIGIAGRIALDFIRESETAEGAILSAIDDVLSALPAARLIEAAPDFVGYTDVAELVGRSRQNMRKLLLSSSKPGPIPVHEGVCSVWHLSPVLQWLRDERAYAIQDELLELAAMTMTVNIAATQVNFGFPEGEHITGLLRGSSRGPVTRRAAHA